MGQYRYIQDVSFSYPPQNVDIQAAWVGLKRQSEWVWQYRIGPHDMIRWVAAPDEGIIDAVPVCDPILDGMSVNMIFDTERDRSLHPKSLRDLRLQWGEPWEDYDDEISWWRKRPKFVWIRRRVKRAKLFAEQIIWVLGEPVIVSSGPLDPRDDCC